MDSIVRQGVVNNGRTTLGVVDLEKFTFLITAERSRSPQRPGSRAVLRAQSPATRLFPPDLLQLTLGSMTGPGTAENSEHGSPHHDPASTPDQFGWTTVPMPPGITMLPAEMALRPEPGRMASVGPSRAGPAAGADQVERRRHPAAGGGRGAADHPGPNLHHVRLQRPAARSADRGGARTPGSRCSSATICRSPRRCTGTASGWTTRTTASPDLTQPAVPPGGEFTYHLRFPDAGIYWYHPHVREDIQQELGLYGNMLVRPDSGRGVRSGQSRGGAHARRHPGVR